MICRLIYFAKILFFVIFFCKCNGNQSIIPKNTKDFYCTEELNLGKECVERISQELSKKNTYELKWDDKDLPLEIKKNPRIFIGKVKNPFISNGYHTIAINNLDYKYDEGSNTFYGINNKRYRNNERDFKNFIKKNKKYINSLLSYSALNKEGSFNLKKGDITIDISKKSDIQGNAWDPKTVISLQNLLKDKKPKAIIFERIDLMPLDYSKYILNLINSKDFMFYRIKYGNNKILNIYRGLPRPLREGIYKHCNYKFYPEVFLKKINLKGNYPFLAQYTKSDIESIYIKELDKVKKKEEITLEKILEKKQNSHKNKVLHQYYDILAPGGKIIFMSASAAFNRHGGIIFKYKNELYSPFKNLDDINLKKLYKKLFEEIGFKNIQFLKDPVFKEDVLYITAYKPR